MIIIKRITLIILSILIYQFAIRPVRVAIINYWIYPGSKTMIQGKQDMKITKNYSAAIRVEKKSKNNHYEEITAFKAPFGIYFIFSILIIVGLGISWRWILYESIYQLLIFFMAYSFLSTGLQRVLVLLNFISLLDFYLLPAFSFGIVAFAWYNEKGNAIEGQNEQSVTAPLHPRK